MCKRLIASICAVALVCIEASGAVRQVRESGGLRAVSAVANASDLGKITVTFSEDVIGALDPYFYYLEDINDPSYSIAVSNVVYGVSSNIIVLSLESPRDPDKIYNLNITGHSIQDRSGYPLPDPTVVRVTTCEDYPVRLVGAVGNPDQSTITLLFSSSVDPAAAQNTNNYAMSGGLIVRSASVDSNQVTLTTSGAREIGRNYTLTIRNLKDDVFCSNTIYPNPTVVSLTQDVRLLSFDAVWWYQNDGLDLGSAWKLPQYDDSTWPQGPGLLGFETTAVTLMALSNQSAFVGTRLNITDPSGDPIITDYFRTLVNVPFDVTGVTFTIRHAVDDGAVFYFNGAEAARFNMPTGSIDYLTLAPTLLPEGAIRSITNLTGLTPGLNSFAVEVHQQAPTSGDILFGAELIARVPRFAGRLAIVRNPDRTLTISWLPRAAILEEASELDGTWSVVQNVVNPMHLPAATGTRFYRLREP